MTKLQRPDIGGLKKEKIKLERPARPPRGKQWPDFNSLFDNLPADPLEAMDMTGDPEQDADAEGEGTRQAFIENEQGNLDAYRTMIDSEFYLVVCFQSRGQKEEFLDKAGWVDLGDKYIDGLKVAGRLGVDVAPVALPTKKPSLMPRPLRGLRIIPKGGDS